MRHSIKNKDEATLVGDCAVCGPAVRLHNHGNGRLSCWKKHNDNRRNFDWKNNKPWRAVVSDRISKKLCEECGFRALDECQLDVDHVRRRADGGTDDPENLVVICANCHRLKTKREWARKSPHRKQ